MRRRHFLIAAVGLAAAGCGPSRPEARGSGPRLFFQLPAEGGGVIDFTSFRGRPLVVHLFTTWAMPAHDDADRLQRTFAENPDIALVGVALDREGPRIVAAWRRGLGVTYPVAIATEAVRRGQSPFGPVPEVPATLLFDAEGRLIRRWNHPLGPSGIEEIRRLARLPERRE